MPKDTQPAPPARICFNCHTTESPEWRPSKLNAGERLCNSCGLYERKHQQPRPVQVQQNYLTTSKRSATVGKFKSCFVCHTTSDSSKWRRSTLNPGQILCNKCGLHERIHNRARPVHRSGGNYPKFQGCIRKLTPAAEGTSSNGHAPPIHGKGEEDDSDGVDMDGPPSQTLHHQVPTSDSRSTPAKPLHNFPVQTSMAYSSDRTTSNAEQDLAGVLDPRLTEEGQAHPRLYDMLEDAKTALRSGRIQDAEILIDRVMERVR